MNEVIESIANFIQTRGMNDISYNFYRAYGRYERQFNVLNIKIKNKTYCIEAAGNNYLDDPLSVVLQRVYIYKFENTIWNRFLVNIGVMKELSMEFVDIIHNFDVGKNHYLEPLIKPCETLLSLCLSNAKTPQQQHTESKLKELKELCA